MKIPFAAVWVNSHLGWPILGLTVVLLAFIFAVALYGSFETTGIPFLAVPYTPKDFGFAFENVSFLSHDGLRLTGWFLPALHPSDKTVIILHGLGSNSGDMLLNSIFLMKPGKWNLFYFNFRGHADSGGNLTSLGPLELKDLESALGFLRKEKPLESKRLAIYGHSLGASVAIVGAAKHPELEAVAVESPFTSTRETVARFGRLYYGIPDFPFLPLSLLITRLRTGVWLSEFSPIEAVGRISPRPFYLIHAERDVRMPTSGMQAIMAAAKEPKELLVVAGADHGEPWLVAKEEYESRMVGFFERSFK